MVSEWVSYLRDEKLWGNDDPLFPATRVALGPDRQFAAAGLSRQQWSNATAIQKIFREALPMRACHISIPTASEIPLSSSARRSARHPSSSRRGARTWGMRRF